jgi:putative ABC transport system permease protein
MEMNLEVRTAGSLGGVAASMRREVAVLDKDLPLLGMRTLKAHFDDALSQERLSAFLLTCLGGLALALAAIGIYGVLSYSVARRTREIGIRMALGADKRTVVAGMLGGVFRLVGGGLLAGILASLSLTQHIRKLLYGLSPGIDHSGAAGGNCPGYPRLTNQPCNGS